MNRKITFYTEISYLLGLTILAFGTAFMEKADFGMSMVVAPAYILHLKISEFFSFFSFGMSEYCFQAFLILLLLIVMRKFKLMYVFSFVTAILYGFILDFMLSIVSHITLTGFAWSMVYYLSGMILCAIGVALLFHTYIAPEAYELIVKEIAGKYGYNIGNVKTIYDITSCLLAVILSFLFFGFGHFEGVKLGTIFCALVNGKIIGFINLWLEHSFDFKDILRTSKQTS